MDDTRPDRATPDVDPYSLLDGPAPRPPTSAKLNRDAVGDGYAIDGPEPEIAPKPAIPTVEVPPGKPGLKPAPRERARAETRPRKPVSTSVDPVWSRGREWGSDLIRLGVWLVVGGWLLISSFGVDRMALGAVAFLAYLATASVLAYPIFITLERPVRVTPEQAVRDFCSAFSHLVPHTRRMWLLLSDEGRVSSRFSDYPAFRAYWKTRLEGWKSANPGSGVLNPFSIEVSEFESDKSAGKDDVEAGFTFRVVRREGESTPVARSTVRLVLVRGPDRMWYLGSGTLGDF